MQTAYTGIPNLVWELNGSCTFSKLYLLTLSYIPTTQGRRGRGAAPLFSQFFFADVSVQKK